MTYFLQISDLTPLRENPNYRNVDDVYLDHNLINSIDVLEGGFWLDRFRLLNLQNNLLKKVNNSQNETIWDIFLNLTKSLKIFVLNFIFYMKFYMKFILTIKNIDN